MNGIEIRGILIRSQYHDIIIDELVHSIHERKDAVEIR
jgi:hypothetical protein